MVNIIDFEDAVTGANLDPKQTVAVFYIDGLYQNEAAVRARCPRAVLYAITVLGRTGKGIFACDSETGDLPIPQTVAWVEEQIKLGVDLICVYANLDRWERLGLKTALAKYGPRIKRWVADYDDSAVIPKGYDAKQYAGGMTSSVDKDVALTSFFKGVAPHKPKPKPKPPVTKPAPKPVPQSDLEPIKDRLYRRIIKRLLPTRFGGFRP